MIQKIKSSNKVLIFIGNVALVIGFSVGFGTASYPRIWFARETTSLTESSMNPNNTHNNGHNHALFNVDASTAPTIDLVVEKDTKSGWNLQIVTENFVFNPDNVNGENIMGQGHAHLYVNEQKVARLYSAYFHYDQNFDEPRIFKVTLNTNDHKEYAVDGEVIQVERVINPTATNSY